MSGMSKINTHQAQPPLWLTSQTCGFLLGKSLDAMTLGFALLVVATVFLGRRMANTPTPIHKDSRSDT
jgi:hypothetical protein